MTGTRRSGGWRSETVLAAIVTGAAAVVVAVVGLVGGFGGGDGVHPTDSPRPQPRISISETTFTVGGTGTVTIRVAGITSAFRSGDRLYAIARPPAVKRWWVSDPVTPLVGGDWVALIEASPREGEQLTVSAVRIPAEELDSSPGAVPTTGTPSAGTTTPSPDGGSRAAAIEQELRARGQDASAVEAVSDPVTAIAPST